MSKRIIFNMENRGSDFIFHWYILMLGALRRIPNDIVTIGPDSSEKFILQQNLNDIDKYSIKLKPPYYITTSTEELRDFHLESLDLIKTDYVFIPKNDINSDDIVVNSYGEPNVPHPNDGCQIDKSTYYFLKQLFLKNIKDDSKKFENKKYFISRNKAHLLHGNSGIKRRHITNNDELKSFLQQYGFECIDLEDFHTIDKIKIFNQAQTIISPNSGALTFSMFGGSNTKIIEMNTHNPHQVDHLYRCMCILCDIPYYKFYTDKVDYLDNMSVDTNKLFNFLTENYLI